MKILILALILLFCLQPATCDECICDTIQRFKHDLVCLLLDFSPIPFAGSGCLFGSGLLRGDISDIFLGGVFLGLDALTFGYAGQAMGAVTVITRMVVQGKKVLQIVKVESRVFKSFRLGIRERRSFEQSFRAIRIAFTSPQDLGINLAKSEFREQILSFFKMLVQKCDCKKIRQQEQSERERQRQEEQRRRIEQQEKRRKEEQEKNRRIEQQEKRRKEEQEKNRLRIEELERTLKQAHKREDRITEELEKRRKEEQEKNRLRIEELERTLKQAHKREDRIIEQQEKRRKEEQEKNRRIEQQEKRRKTKQRKRQRKERERQMKKAEEKESGYYFLILFGGFVLSFLELIYMIVT